MSTVSWDLGEDVRNEVRRLQDEEWKDAEVDGRRHVSHREASEVYANEFAEAIKQFEIIKLFLSAIDSARPGCALALLCKESLQSIIDFAYSPKHSNLLYSWERYWKMRSELNWKRDLDYSFRVCVRKRPLFPHEMECNAYDCISTDKELNLVTLHDGRMARNGRQLTLSHRQYFVDKIFDDRCTNQQVCTEEVESLIENARDGYCSTLICFGQTGTGKTYTLTAALDHVLSRFANESIEVSFVEIHGRYCYDLLNGRRRVPVRADENDNVHIRGATTLRSRGSSRDKGEVDCTGAANIESATSKVSAKLNAEKERTVDVIERIPAEELRCRLEAAMDLRSSEVTERNPISSRSHAVCSIRLVETLENAASIRGSSDNRRVVLVDLAGSERNYETVQMTAAQHRESAEINTALMALKDCFRAYDGEQERRFNDHLDQQYSLQNQTDVSNRQHSNSYLKKAPYRASLLTRVLKECFHKDGLHRTVIVATVSPSPTDLLHSVNTLRHVLLMSPTLKHHTCDVTVEVPLRGAAPRHIPVEDWTAEELASWLVSAENGRFAQLVLPPEMDGYRLLQFDMDGLGALFQGELRAARQEEEGAAWVETVDGSRRLGRALWQALRLEQAAIAKYREEMGTM